MLSHTLSLNVIQPYLENKPRKSKTQFGTKRLFSLIDKNQTPEKIKPACAGFESKVILFRIAYLSEFQVILIQGNHPLVLAQLYQLSHYTQL